MEIIVSGNEAGQRLDQILKKYFSDISRVKIQKGIREGLCIVDGEKAFNPNRKIGINQKIIFSISPENTQAMPEAENLHILWNDADIAVCDKPAGITVHPCPSCPDHTLVNQLLSRFPVLANQGGYRPGIAHRLDKDTSGLILIALTENCRLKLSDAFAQHEIDKEYLALVHGIPDERGQCNMPIGRHAVQKTRMAVVPEKNGGRSARSSWRRLWFSETANISLLAVKIYTGRTHQIRVHLSQLGYPILGDKTYAPAHVGKMAPRQMLHAWQLAFNHPLTGQRLNFLAAPPEDFYDTIINYHRQPNIIVTGNQGCGKSFFCRMLEDAGFSVKSADKIVANLYQNNRDVADWLEMRFGMDELTENHRIKKDKLFNYLTEIPDFRRDFENFIHPIVLDEIKDFFNHASQAKPAIAEIPLFFECGWQKMFSPRPVVVGIHCPREIRFQRIRDTRGWPQEKINILESWQISEEKKMAACDRVISNGDSRQSFQIQAENFIKWLEQQKISAIAKLRMALDKIFTKG